MRKFGFTVLRDRGSKKLMQNAKHPATCPGVLNLMGLLTRRLLLAPMILFRLHQHIQRLINL